LKWGRVVAGEVDVRVDDGSDRADRDGDRRPGVDSEAEDDYAQGRRSQYSGRPRFDRSNGAYACFGSGVVSFALAP